MPGTVDPAIEAALTKVVIFAFLTLVPRSYDRALFALIAGSEMVDDVFDFGDALIRRIQGETGLVEQGTVHKLFPCKFFLCI